MPFLEKIAERIEDLWYRNVVRTGRVRRWILGVTVYIILLLILSVNFIPNMVDLEVGEVSPRDIESPSTMEYINEERTEQLKQQVALSVPNVYTEDKEVEKEVISDIDKTFNSLREIQEKELDSSGQEFKDLVNKIPLDLEEEQIESALMMSPRELNEAEEITINIIREILRSGVREDRLPEAREEIDNKIEQHNMNQANMLIAEISKELIRPNILLDHDSTRERREQALGAVEPVKRTILQGEVIIRKGDVVTQEDISILEELGLRQEEIDFISFLGLALILLIITTIVAVYLKQIHPEIYKKESYLLLLGLIIILVILLGKIIINLPVLRAGYLVPVAAGSMLLAILFNSQVSVMATFVMALITGVMTGYSLEYSLIAAMGGLIAVFSVRKVSQRSDLTRAGFLVGAVNMFGILGIGMMGQFSGYEITKEAALGIINGIGSAILTIGILPYLESLFGVTSSIKLLELSNPNHPLLKNLLIKAPGSYHHSILVGNLAEAAAEEVGGDSLLARVGAFYHDIGKIKRPYFFTENQVTSDNPHDKIAPSLSTLIITSHVKDGVEMAEEHKLPQPVIDIIEQHHAENLVSFFYQQSLEDDKDHEQIKKDDFRYEGPKPQTKEAAIVMLADCIEAAVRSFSNPSPGRIEGKVHQIIKERLNAGQLDECDLTLKELDRIADAFVLILKGIFHSRVEYPHLPDSAAKELKGE